jgi:hypothetical protein
MSAFLLSVGAWFAAASSLKLPQHTLLNLICMPKLAVAITPITIIPQLVDFPGKICKTFTGLYFLQPFSNFSIVFPPNFMPVWGSFWPHPIKSLFASGLSCHLVLSPNPYLGSHLLANPNLESLLLAKPILARPLTCKSHLLARPLNCQPLTCIGPLAARDTWFQPKSQSRSCCRVGICRG